MEWKPIETAPTDGTWVLLKGGSVPYRWDGDTEPPMVVAQFSNYLNGVFLDEGRWHFAWYDGGYYGIYEGPTHWADTPTI